MQLIQVFSPHFDDAVLSCGEHILCWQTLGFEVEVVTVFTQFATATLSADSQEFMKNSGASTVTDLQNIRLNEDQQALKQLGVKHVSLLTETDGGFREHRHRPVYETHQQLFAGQVLDSDTWQEQFFRYLSTTIRSDAQVIVPLGVGQHADHLLVRQAVERVVPKKKISFYVDIPYALQFGNWTFQHVWQCVQSTRSIFWSSAKKLAAVQIYGSQTPLLFPTGLWQYPECVIGEI